MTLRQELVNLVVHGQVALFDGNVEISDPSYERAALQKLTTEGDRLSGIAEFGPFFAYARFNRVVLMDGDRPLQDLPMPSRVEVPKGKMYEYTLTATVRG